MACAGHLLGMQHHQAALIPCTKLPVPALVPPLRHALVRLFERCQWLQRLALMPAGSQQEPSCLAFEVLFALAAHCGDLRQLKLSEELLPVSCCGLYSCACHGRNVAPAAVHGWPGPHALRGGSKLGLLAAHVAIHWSLQCWQHQVPSVCHAVAAGCSARRRSLQVAGLDDSCLAPVAAGCPLLQHLELVQLEVGDALLGLLAQHCRGLQVLRLEQTYASDAGVAAVVEVRGMHGLPACCTSRSAEQGACRRSACLDAVLASVAGAVSSQHQPVCCQHITSLHQAH